MSAELERLAAEAARTAYWKRWGPYLSERAWATVREDYSPDGTAWDYFTHDQARSKAYRWGEDGLAGICDRRQYLCFALALWNGRDPILKERLFGLTGPQGNHGEDVKEYYFYLDSTPTHSYMRCLYKYPQAAFPYDRLVEENGRRGCSQPEFELMDTGVFDDDRYFDVFVEYAKAAPEDILIRVTAVNRGPEAASLEVLPTLWFRNNWAWGGPNPKPMLRKVGPNLVECTHFYLNQRTLLCDGADELLFTENETNNERLYGVPNATPFVKDAFHEYVVDGRKTAVNPEHVGTRVAARYRLAIPAGGTETIRLRFTNGKPSMAQFRNIFSRRQAEADRFYADLPMEDATEDARQVQRQAFAGMLWSKQFYYYDVSTWLTGDPGTAEHPLPPPPPQRLRGRNSGWTHLYADDILSVPDKWEYPWFASWDTAFHCITYALIDPDFAKQQLILLLREWYMHPNGQIPAYEWSFGDVDPPVHAWACWRVYQIERRRRGKGDLEFLERAFHKLLLNFTWWVNRKDAEDNNLFEGGFLGLDNIGIFDRSAPLPTGGFIEQSDGTSWMAMFTLNMLTIALELAGSNRAYSDIASKFFEHFVHITDAMNRLGSPGTGLWDDEDGFYYDLLRSPDGRQQRLKVRSMVGLIPLCAVAILDPAVVDELPGFKSRMEWFLTYHPVMRRHVVDQPLADGRIRRLLSIVNMERFPRLLHRMLDEGEFLSDYGLRSMSRAHRDNPFRLWVDGREYSVDYEPAESETQSFGGNSNWRGPVWFPVNFLILESLQKFDYFLGESYQVEMPTGTGQMKTLWEVAGELSRRLNRLFLRDQNGQRPVYAGRQRFQEDPHWRDLILFYEYFNGDTGEGLGASHQTGWTGLTAKLLQQSGE